MLLCFSAFSLIQVKVEASNPVGTNFEFSIQTKFGEAAPTVSNLGSKDYGSKVVVDANSYLSEGYEFIAYVVNGKVEPTLPASNEFIVSSDLHVEALYREDTKYSVLFIDSNQDFLKVEFVDKSGTADATAPTTASLAKPGYVVSTTSPWSGSCVDVTSNLVLHVQYDKTILDSYTLSVENGTGAGTYGYNEVATVTANTVVGFQYWLNNGVVASLQPTYSFTVLEDTNLTAVYFEDNSTTHIADSLFISLSNPYSFTGGYDTYVGQFNLPAGNELVEFGILAYNGNGEFTLDEIDGVSKFRCDDYLEQTGEFMVSLDTANPTNTRAYMITTDGLTETVTYSFYHDNIFISEYGEGSSNNKWIEIYNPNPYPVDLSKYFITLFSNGTPTGGNDYSFPGTTLAANDVFVLYNPLSVQEVKDKGDIDSSVCLFNGDDALGLFKDGFILDQFGVIGEDPGSAWTWATDGTTVNKTLIRDIFLENPSSKFDSSEWLVTYEDNFTDIGYHIPTKPASITIEGGISVYAGNTLELSVTYPANSLEGVTWSSNNELVATVDANGVVTGVAGGTVTFTATSTVDGTVTDTHIVTVNAIVDYTVYYEENGGTAVLDEVVASGSTATEPVNPTKADNTFGGWYTEVTLENPFNFATAITADTTLYAKWIPAGVEVLAYSSTFNSDENFASSTLYNKAERLFGPTGQQWGIYYGTPSTTSAIEFDQSLQCRYYDSTPSNIGYMRTDFTVTDVTKVTFSAKNANSVNVLISYSVDNGSSWTDVETIVLSTSATTYTSNINATGEVMIRFTMVITLPNSSGRLYIDEVEIYGMT